MMISPLKILPSLKKAYQLLSKNDPLILSSSTAFFATFSLSPILIILTDLLSPFMGREKIHHELFSKIHYVFGGATARDVHTIVDGFEAQESNIWLTIFSTIFFYFVATTLLSVIKQAIHQLWRIRRKDNVGAIYNVKERLIGIGLMFLVAGLATISYFMDQFQEGLKHDQVLFSIVGNIFSLIIITIWFTLLLKLLPEAKVKWTVAIIGGLLTSVFFKMGLILFGKLLVHRQVAIIFGVSSSMAILLLFIFYCSFILYLGISFTYEYAIAIRKNIRPGKYAVEFQEEIRVKGRSGS